MALADIEDGRSRRSATRVVSKMERGADLIIHHASTGRRVYCLSGREVSGGLVSRMLSACILERSGDALFPDCESQSLRLAQGSSP